VPVLDAKGYELIAITNKSEWQSCGVWQTAYNKWLTLSPNCELLVLSAYCIRKVDRH